MKPVSPPSIINYGIAVYFPGQQRPSNQFIQLDIFYSKENPLFSWVECDNKLSKIWSKRELFQSNGALFLYELSSPLELGFYTLKASFISADSQIKEGQLFIGLTSPTPNLIVGLPYSVYPPIDLS